MNPKNKVRLNNQETKTPHGVNAHPYKNIKNHFFEYLNLDWTYVSESSNTLKRN